ncbi:BnaC04g53760D [Brassica napus]|uniref:BnaC04g53760D protein n=1 Tax=Brassica napus TaxID=3708 RepID=A0A078IL89_BRANA|nr:BnaC04g53760D [Brassica napus]
MDIVGEFHLIENDGKSFLEYHHSKYHPIPQIQSPPSSDNKFINNHFLQSLFLCPKERWRDAFRVRTQHYTFHPIISSPECCYTYHSVHPLFWCNNKEFEKDGGCDICNGVDFGTDYYLCVYCDEKYHRECVQSPLKIKSPYHPQHSLQLYYRRYIPPIIKCLCSHKDCMYFPRIIKISRHRHRISYTTSLQSGEWFCGVCRQSIETSYGAYTCDKCCDYFVHSICALGKDMWDGKDLEGVPEEDDITEDVVPFIMISKGVILHFLHDHHLYLQVSMLYDENKFCQACVLPIFEALNPEEKPICHICKIKLRYKHDKHFLRVLCGEEVCEKSWCEVCEHDLRDTNVIYWCDECCITVHIDCLFGKDPYLKHGHFYKLYGYKHQTFCKSNTSRPLCNYCRKRCQNKIFMRDNIMLCSVRCVYYYYKKNSKNDGFKQHDQPSAPTIGLVMTAQDYTRHKSRLISLGLGLSF